MQVDTTTLFELFDAAMAADYTRLRRLGGQVARTLAENKDLEAARTLKAILKQRAVPLQTSGYSEALPRDAGSRLPLVEESAWPTTPVFIDEQDGRVISRFLEDAQNVSLLAKKGVASRLAFLIYGLPGTGKSLLAGHIAAQLERPLYNIRLDSLISSRLGETAKNIRGVFDYTPNQEAVLFLDEMDAIAKIRDDKHELGELKRVVNTVLQGLDSMSDNVVVIGATNHPHLLDAAIWRRFPYKLELKMPAYDVRREMWRHFLYEGSNSQEDNIDLIASISDHISGADIENIALAARRRAILDGSSPTLLPILNAVVGSRSGAPEHVHDEELSIEERRRLARTLRDTAGMTVIDIARLFGISRQMVHRYLHTNEVGHAD